MANKLTKQDAKKIADLIKIYIPEEDLEKYATQLNIVLDAVEVFKEIDTANVAETSQTHGLVNVLAEDEPEAGLDMSKYPNTKNFKNKYFVVGRVL